MTNIAAAFRRFSGVLTGFASVFRIFTVVLPCFLWSISLSRAETIIISTDDHPPLIQGHSGPKYKPGIMTDLAKAAFEAQGHEVRFLYVPAARTSWSIIEEKAHAVVGPLGWFRGDAADKIVSVPIYPAAFHFFYLKRKFPQGLSYQRLEELKSYKVGYMFGGAASRLLDDAGLSVDYVNDRDQNTRKLYLGRIDLLVTEGTGGWASIAKLYPTQLADFEKSDQIILDAPGNVIFKKENTELFANFQKGLAEIKKNGTYMKIVQRYFPPDGIPKGILDYIN